MTSFKPAKPAPVGQCRDPEKVRFYVKHQAEQFARDKTAEHGAPQYVYPCGMHFHLTTGGKKAREREAREQEKQAEEEN